jgi:hypothetical protein
MAERRWLQMNRHIDAIIRSKERGWIEDSFGEQMRISGQMILSAERQERFTMNWRASGGGLK